MRNLLYLAILAIATLVLSGCGELKSRERIVGYRGEARYNEFLASEMLFESFGYETEGLAGLVGVPDESGILVLGGSAIPARGTANKLNQWIWDGGHLIYLVESDDNFFNEIWNDGEDSPHPLLDDFGIELITEGDFDHKQVVLDDEEYEVRLGTEVAFDLEFATETIVMMAGEINSSPLASLEYGYGRLTVVNREGLFANQEIGDLDHAAVLYQLVDAGPFGKISFVYGSSDSFWAMLWREGWMVIVGLGALIFFWLWKNLLRFGPLIQEEVRGLRHFGDHISMVGHFLWRQRCSEGLLAPVRERLKRLCQKKYFHNQTPPPDELIGKLSQLSGLSSERVSEALSAARVREQAVFVRLMQDLQQIESSL